MLIAHCCLPSSASSAVIPMPYIPRSAPCAPKAANALHHLRATIHSPSPRRAHFPPAISHKKILAPHFWPPNRPPHSPPQINKLAPARALPPTFSRPKVQSQRAPQRRITRECPPSSPTHHSPTHFLPKYPHGESNPGFRTENPTSWATRRWGRVAATDFSGAGRHCQHISAACGADLRARFERFTDPLFHGA